VTQCNVCRDIWWLLRKTVRSFPLNKKSSTETICPRFGHIAKPRSSVSDPATAVMAENDLIVCVCTVV